MTRSTEFRGPFAATVFALGLVCAALLQPAAAASVNDTARYLAGLPPSSGSPLAALTREAAWVRHARSLDQAWARIEKAQLRRIRAWSAKHIPAHRSLMLYMFSGPDFLYANAFYPHASTYLLAALEPVGPRPNVTRLTRGQRAGALQNLRASMQSVLTFSFFITKQMKSDLRQGGLSGALPVLYVFLARSGKTIQEVAHVTLNRDGSLTPRGQKTSKGGSRGVKIVFSGKDGTSRTLYYFATDLSNWGLKTSGFLKLAESLGPADSLVKSASYLLHSGNFSTARDFLLRHSAVLVQDDSGIPLRYFNRTKWDLSPFGTYTGPIAIFPNNYQHDMRKLFARGRARKIDFGIGYKWRTHQTNVLLAISKSQTQ